MAPKEGNSIVKHGVLDERLNVHGVKNLKVADLSICPDNVGCNTCTTPPLPPSQRALVTNNNRLHRPPNRREVRHAHRRRSRLQRQGPRDEGPQLPRPRRIVRPRFGKTLNIPP